MKDTFKTSSPRNSKTLEIKSILTIFQMSVLIRTASTRHGIPQNEAAPAKYHSREKL